jgi:hypothetical protein
MESFTNCRVKALALRPPGLVLLLEVQLQTFVIFGTRGDKLALRSGRYPDGESALGTQWNSGWVSLNAGLDAGANRKSLFPPEINPRMSGRPTRILVTTLNELHG